MGQRSGGNLDGWSSSLRVNRVLYVHRQNPRYADRHVGYTYRCRMLLRGMRCCPSHVERAVFIVVFSLPWAVVVALVGTKTASAATGPVARLES